MPKMKGKGDAEMSHFQNCSVKIFKVLYRYCTIKKGRGTDKNPQSSQIIKK